MSVRSRLRTLANVIVILVLGVVYVAVLCVLTVVYWILRGWQRVRALVKQQLLADHAV